MSADATNCLVCGASAFAPHLEILQRCTACGFVTARLDDPMDARALYEGDYFTGGEYLDYAADELFFRRNFRKRLKEVRRCVPTGRLIEVGSAYGYFLDEARAIYDGIGFEVNAEAVRHAREQLRLDVRSDDLLALDVERLGGLGDVAVMWDVIEHLDRPDRFVAKLAELCRPGAMLFITTGDIGSRVARLRGRRWRMIHPPTHLHYFDRRTLPMLLDRCGFALVDLRSVGYARGLRQMLYGILALRLGLPGAYAWARRLIPASWGLSLDLGDIMLAVARRR